MPTDRAQPHAFSTTREELFRRLCLRVQTGYVATEGEYGPGRRYHMTVGDWLDALRAFCDEKEGREPGVSGAD